MITGGGINTRLDSALLAPWPEPIDIKVDIYIPGKVEAFKAALKQALASRQLLAVIVERPPTLHDIALANPDADASELQEALIILTNARAKATFDMANLLPRLIKPESLTYVETKDLSTLVGFGDGVAIHDFIQRSVDLRYGSVQDKLRQKYSDMKVTPTDDITTVSKQVDLKWFLHCHHTLYDVQAAHGRKEGIREVLTMLLNGPGNIAGASAQPPYARLSHSVQEFCGG